jgi:hypothetical protein
MAAYLVTRYTIEKGSIEDAVAAMETQLETVTDTKTVRLAKILPTASGKYMVVLVYDT